MTRAAGSVALTVLVTVSVGLGCSAAGDSCRSRRECGSGEDCATPSDVPVCGIGCAAERGCATAADCGAGMACTEYVGACCAPWQDLSSRCTPACTVTSCGEGERCGASGACEPIPCSDGYSCPRQWRCVAAGSGVERHGCQRIACTSDGDCDSPGYCVEAQCRDALGHCEVPMLVP